MLLWLYVYIIGLSLTHLLGNQALKEKPVPTDRGPIDTIQGESFGTFKGVPDMPTTFPLLLKMGTSFRGNRVLAELFSVSDSRLNVWFLKGWCR